VLAEIRAVCRLSWSKLAYIGHRLFCQYEEPAELHLVGKWRPHTVGGTDVPFPKLATRNLIKKYHASLSEYHQRTVDPDTGISALGFPLLFVRSLRNVEWPFFSSVVAQMGGLIEFNLMLDAHG